MKMIILLSLFISNTCFSATTVLDCIQDASDYGSHTHPVKPAAECLSLISENENKIEIQSADKSISIVGLGNMLYVKSSSGTLLLAGPQTSLKTIEGVWVDTINRRIFVHQKNEVLTFDLDFVGNVQPLKLMRSEKLKGIVKVEMNSETLNLSLEDGSRFSANADAEARNLSSRKDLKLTSN